MNVRHPFLVGLVALLLSLPAAAQSITLDFETDDDATPIANGQVVEFPAAFGLYLELTSTGANQGLATYDSTPGGPNDPGADPDLLVDEGNLLILQSNDNPDMTGGIFDTPNDSAAGGQMIFDFAPAVNAGYQVRVDSIDVVDRDKNGDAFITLTDAAGLTRIVTVPQFFTGEINQGQVGIATIDLLTGNPTESPENPGQFTTVVTQPGFDITNVVMMVVLLEGSGAVDNLEIFLVQLECTTGLECEDGDLCTQDLCVDDVCSNPPVDCTRRDTICNPADGQCVDCLTDGDCIDADPCTVDLCTPDLTCENNPVSCPDNNDVCTDLACDPMGLDGNCDLEIQANEGGSCDDGDPCTTGEVCVGGACGGGVAVDCSHLDDPCQVGLCSPSSGQCEAQPANENDACDDGDPCNTGEVCTGGSCAGGSPVMCPDSGNACTVLACDPQGAEGNCDSEIPLADDEPCEDGDPCTTGEVCTGGTCGGGVAVDCSDLDDQCQVGVCNPSSGECEAQPANENEACDDGEPCTTGEVCIGGACGGGVAVDCSDLDGACVVGICDPASGECQALPVNPGGTCDDGDACTDEDECRPDGSCRGTPIPGCGVPVPTTTRTGMLLLMGLLLAGVLAGARRNMRLES